jgi:hypothetical protein
MIEQNGELTYEGLKNMEYKYVELYCCLQGVCCREAWAIVTNFSLKVLALSPGYKNKKQS